MDVALRSEVLLAGASRRRNPLPEARGGAIVVPAARPCEAAQNLLKLVFEKLAGVDGPPFMNRSKGMSGPTVSWLMQCEATSNPS